MNKKIFFISFYFTLTVISAFAQIEQEPAEPALPESPVALETKLALINNLEPIKASDRILILAPHPDDESLGCAGIIQEAVRAGADTHILYLTNGDNNQFAFIVYEKRIPLLPGALIRLGEIRRSESIKAMKMLGLEEYNLIFLGYPDFGTFRIFKNFWQVARPYRSMLTRVTSVPYKQNPSFGSPYIGESILRDLKNTLLRYKPNKIFVSHPADLNSDHRALYLFLEVALADLINELPHPEIYSYLVHWKAWPLPRHYHPEVPLLPPKEFPATPSDIHWLKHRLAAQDLKEKHKAILTYRSQTESSAFYLLSFGRKDELFSVYPQINLEAQPKPQPEKPLSLKERIASFLGLTNVLPETDSENPVTIPTNSYPVVYSSENNCLLVRIYKSKDIERTLKTVVYLFGYSYKTPFAQMPKILMLTKHTRFKMLDGAKVIAGQGVSLEMEPEELVIRIPFSLLGNPDFILASVRGNAGVSYVDTLSFRKINIKNRGRRDD
jgi:LmbE family N-acetylglucosaminyl deacetylase